MYTIAKTFAFSASHIIGGLPPEHPCGRLHGHNYEVEVILQAAALDGVGFVRDYRELSALKEFLDATLDHNHLNDVRARQDDRRSARQVALRLVQNALAGSRCGACL
jgi:6-pyruvoyltetrahydropterin/6-carboxytetrahydropterin synthase